MHQDTDIIQKKQSIQQIKERKNAIIMAHYYVDDVIQEIADYVGDSFYLSKVAQETSADMIVLCGVSFMGESAKLLNPNKKVLLPAVNADCPMAHMATKERIAQIREEYEDVAVVCYVNSTAELKAASDVCVTSANALAVIRALPNKHIFLIPDQNLARYLASQLPEKEFIFHDGYCPIHHAVRKEQLLMIKQQYPNALVLAHPECRPEILECADYVGSTAGIITYVGKQEASAETCCDAKEYIIVTEVGVLYELKRKYPHNIYHSLPEMVCPDMKTITLDLVLSALEEEMPEVLLSESLLQTAQTPLTRMLELAQK